MKNNTVIRTGYGAFGRKFTAKMIRPGEYKIITEWQGIRREIPFSTMAEMLNYFETYTTPIIEQR